MTSTPEPVSIKKYANRRLYNTGTSKYVTLENLAEMVKRGEEFEVQDAKTGADLTRSVLTQIIFEQEAKDGHNLLPISFLRQLIGYYGDAMQPMVPSFLEHTMNSFVAEQEKFREQMSKAFGQIGLADMEKQVTQNMEMFQKAVNMFNPFVATGKNAATPMRDQTDKAEGHNAKQSDLDELKRQMSEMQKKLNDLS